MPSLYAQKIQALRGVGEKRARLFQKLGAPTVGALLCIYPRAYLDLSHPYSISSAPKDAPCAVRARILERPAAMRIRGGMTLYKTRADDGESVMELTFFNNPYVVQLLKEGEEYLFYGKITQNFLKREMSAPEFYPVSSCLPVLPIYRCTQGLSSRMIGNAVKEALRLLPDTMRDPLPGEIRQKYSLCTLRFALENIHFPVDPESAEIARRRLIFEELMVLQLGLLMMRGRQTSEAPSEYRLRKDYTHEFFSLLPFRPTGAQERAVREAAADMAGGSVMSRLVQGDVGSGKTAVAAALCYSAVKNGMQAALMAPTEILAQQHFNTFQSLLEPAGIHTALLTASVPSAEKKKIIAGLASGQIGMVIGTHALLAKNIEFQRLGLVVTDEQHRFGVGQRAALAGKGDRPHMLVMSATPIPRTLALMIYGDLDLSVLDEMPPGRQKTETYAISSEKHPRAFAFLKKLIAEGRQCFIVCPMIGEGQNDMAGVLEYESTLKEKWLPDIRIGALHGKMKPKEKAVVMEAFVQGRIDVLVSTTVVEVGVDVPNATVMMIENAERYGLSQLHQLRGRVGRGSRKSYCILVSDAQNETALARLKIMCATNDGFRIANEDLKLRGPGDFFGQRQHGLPSLKIADMATDMEWLQKAQKEAHDLLSKDDSLSQPEHRGLRAEVRQLFAGMEIS